MAQRRPVHEKLSQDRYGRYLRDDRLRIAMGEFDHLRPRVKQGFTQSVSTSGWQTLWPHQSLAAKPLTSQPLTVSSSSTSDTDGGAGANQVVVEILDDDWEQKFVVVNLNGTTPVSLGSGMRVIEAWVERSGDGSNDVANVGTVFVGYGTVTAGAPANILSVMAPDTNQSSGAMHSVGLGKFIYIDSIQIGASGNHNNAQGMARIVTKQFNMPPREVLELEVPTDVGASVFLDFETPLKLQEFTDIEIQVQAIQSTDMDGMLQLIAAGEYAEYQ